MPLNPYEHEKVAHFRHCVRLESKAQDYRFLHATIESQGTSGTIDALTWDEISARGLQYDGTWFWIYPAASSPGITEGAHYIASAMCMQDQMDTKQCCHNITAAHDPGVEFSLRADNLFDNNEIFFIVNDPDDPDFFTIASWGGGGVLTADIDTGAISLEADTGADNQLWHIKMSYPPIGGCFVTAPELDESQCIQSLTTSPMSYALIGASAQKSAHVALSSEFIERIESPTSLVGNPVTDLAFPVTLAEEKWDRVQVYDEETRRVQFEQGGRPTRVGDRALIPYYAGGGLASLEGVAGTYRSQAWGYNTAGVAWQLSSSDGERDLGAYPTFQDAGPDVTQNWFMLPQNLYDPTLPVPYDITSDLIDDNGATMRLSSTQALPVDDDAHFRLRPTFICDADQFLVTVRVRYLVRGIWSEVDQVIQPLNKNAAQCSLAPLAKFDGSPAWIPNAWRHAWPGQWDGRDGISQDISISDLFDGHDDADACQLTLSVTAMRYGSFTNLPPVPYEGRTASASYIIGRHTEVTLGDATLDGDGIHIPVTSTGNEVTSIHLDSLVLASDGFPTTYAHYLAPGGFDASPVGAEILVPFTALKLIDDDLMSSSSTTIIVSGEARTSYATIEFEDYGTITSSLISQTSLHVTGGAWGGMLTNWIVPGHTYVPSALYQILEGERGRRYVPVDQIPGSAFPIITRSGSYLADASGPIENAMAIGTYDGQACYTIIKRWPPLRPIAALYRRVRDEEYSEHIEVIPLQGNLSASISADNDAVSARRLGGRYNIVGGTGGQEGSLKFTGTIFRGQIDSTIPSPEEPFSLRQDIQALYEISASESVILRMPTGTEYLVRVLGVSSPRDVAESANITIDLIEVEK